jgi:hypothetical protein
MRVAVHGLSFGASMAVFAAAREPVDALWVDGPFSDPLSVMADAVRRRLHVPGGLWVWPVALVALASRRIRIWNVRTGDVASRLPGVPVRVLVYPDDNLVPIRRSLDICRQAGWRDNCRLMYGMGHASAIDFERVEYIAEAASFYRATLLQGSADLEGSADRSVLGTPPRTTGARRSGPTIAR